MKKEKRPFIKITKEQHQNLIKKVRDNVDRMLIFLEDVLGTPKFPKATKGLLECYVIFTHAVEEYGKLLYLESIEQNSDGTYDIEYDSDKKEGSQGYFKNHKKKFELALEALPHSIRLFMRVISQMIFHLKIMTLIQYLLGKVASIY